MLIIQKFGGSSLADFERLRRAAQICLDARRREHAVVAVVSAMGDATDALIDMTKEISAAPPPRELAALITTGEQKSAALLAITLDTLGAKACSLSGQQAGIVTSRRHLDSDIALIAPGRIYSLLSDGIIPVVTGFQGTNIDGDVTALGRGGSDTTAVALAASLGADRCEIYSDVNGIYTADPRVITGARLLESIDYRDMLTLARAGSQVLHDTSVLMAMENGVEIQLLSSFERGAGSTVRHLEEGERPPFAGVTRSEADNRISVSGLAADAGALSRLILELGRAGIEVLSGDVGEGRVSVTVKRELLLPALELTHSYFCLK